MSIYRLDVHAQSSDGIISGMEVLSDRVAHRADAEMIGGWRSPDRTEYVVLETPSERAAADLVESCGLAVDGVSDLSVVFGGPYPKIPEEDDVWCTVCRGYHGPPAH
jgi:hypothetical protein